MKSIADLSIPHSDAENAKVKEEWRILSNIYFRTDFLDALLEPTKYFLCGDKGAGKTAMAIYLCNSEYRSTKADHVVVSDTEIQALNNLAKNGRLESSDQSLLWETALLLRIARLVDGSMLSNGWIDRYSLLRHIKTILESYYEGKQNPEIKHDIEILRNYELSANIASNGGILGASGKLERSTTDRYAIHYDLIQAVNAALKNAIAKAKFCKRMIVFLDGLDHRGINTSPEEYRETLSNLGAVVWGLNNSVFGSIKDTDYRPKIVLLMRPELVDFIRLPNSALKMRENAVELKWTIGDEKNYRNSKIFKMISHILSAQQNEIAIKSNLIWDHYFPYSSQDGNDSFIAMLRRTYHRPRDILEYIKYMRDLTNQKDSFSIGDFDNPQVKRNHSEYLLAEIRNGLEYITSPIERNFIPSFFQHFDGNRKFSFNEYESYYERFVSDCEKRGFITSNTIYENKYNLLQLLYDINIIGYSVETNRGQFYRWHFRERTLGDPCPSVPFDCTYVVHEGLTKALDLGAKRKRPTKKP
jgi:hypothetical protein